MKVAAIKKTALTNAQVWVNSMRSINRLEIKGLPNAGSNNSLSLVDRDVDMTSIQTQDFLHSRFPGMAWTWGPLLWPLAVAAASVCPLLKRCAGGVRCFLEWILFEHLTRTRLSGLFILVLFVWIIASLRKFGMGHFFLGWDCLPCCLMFCPPPLSTDHQ